MSTYKVSYRSSETNRRRSRPVEASSPEEARQLIGSEATEIYSIEFVPPPLASDAQRDYLRAFGDRRWNDSTLTRDQAHDLIDQYVARDAPTDWSFRDSYPATESQFESYHYYGGKLNPDFAKLTQGEMRRLIDRIRPSEGQNAPDPVSPRQALVLRFFFEPAVTNRFMRMTKKDVNLLIDAFYEENPEARKVWDSWKEDHRIPERTHLVDSAKVEQNAYSMLGKPPLSLNCLTTFKTKTQLDAERGQQRQRREEEANVRHRQALRTSQSLPSVDLSLIPYKGWSAAARAFKTKYRKFGAEVMIETRQEIDIFLEENSSEDENQNYSFNVHVFIQDYDGLAWEFGVDVGDEKALEFCNHDSTINRVPTSLPFAPDKYPFERQAYEDFLNLLLNPALAQEKPAKGAKINPLDNPFKSLKAEPVLGTSSEPSALPAADFSILTAETTAPVKKPWWKLW
jgi:hypothetical protein